MSKNIFTIHKDYAPDLNRNTFDLSFRNNLTLKFGELTPVFLKETSPGDSFRINSKFALQFMPTMFPVQTPIKAYLHFFYVRNRNSYKDWRDFITGVKSGLTMPYLQPVDKKKFYRVGGLADYLGVPNVLYNGQNVGQFDQDLSNYQMPAEAPSYSDTNSVQYVAIPNYYSHYVALIGSYRNIAYPSLIPAAAVAQPASTSPYGQPPVNFDFSGNPDLSILPDALNGDLGEIIGSNADELCIPFSEGGNTQSNALAFQTLFDETSGNKYCFAMKVFEGNTVSMPSSFSFSYDMPLVTKFRGMNLPVYLNTDTPATSNKTSDPFHKTNTQNVNLPETTIKRFYFLFVDDDGKVLGYTQRDITLTLGGDTDTPSYSGSVDTPEWQLEGSTATRIMVFTHQILRFGYNDRDALARSSLFTFFGNINASLGVSYSSQVIGDLDSTPYDNDIHLNALPFRAYESVYNAYYRNSTNDPFKPDGINPEYNEFLSSKEGGADTFQYDLYKRNWEFDFLTSALPSPQFGTAPLVGLSTTGAATLEDHDGNRFVVQAQLDSDGNIIGWTTNKENDPSGSLRMLMNMSTTGISINDLRNVNAYQRFLENSIRKGLSYRDQILSHYGVSIRFDELDMPEFLGGASCDVQWNQVSQTSDYGDTPMGSFVGQGYAYGESKHYIDHYCDEHGYIIGILSVVPIPVYSQLLPKHFTKLEQMDYFFPEFNHVGYQPIPQKEVSPLQTFYAGNNLNETFGYNRAYYDLIASVDEVHAQFRTTMSDFVMMRTFENEPKLGKDFLVVSDHSLNDVFLAGNLLGPDGENIYSPDADKIIGSLYFDVSKKSQISLYGLSKIE